MSLQSILADIAAALGPTRAKAALFDDEKALVDKAIANLQVASEQFEAMVQAEVTAALTSGLDQFAAAHEAAYNALAARVTTLEGQLAELSAGLKGVDDALNPPPETAPPAETAPEAPPEAPPTAETPPEATTAAAPEEAAPEAPAGEPVAAIPPTEPPPSETPPADTSAPSDPTTPPAGSDPSPPDVTSASDGATPPSTSDGSAAGSTTSTTDDSSATAPQ